VSVSFDEDFAKAENFFARDGVRRATPSQTSFTDCSRWFYATRSLKSSRHSLRWSILAPNGDDPRALPLSMRKAHLERLLARRPEGIFISPFEQGEIGHGGIDAR
jgi:hypothetical protein